MADYKAEAQALALRYSAANITAPAGQPALQAATEKLPAGLAGMLPIWLVFPPSIDNIRLAGGTRLETQTWPIRLYIMELLPDYSDFDPLLDWLTATRDTLITATHISLPSYVAMAWLESARAGELSYPAGGQKYLGIEHLVKVQISEPISPVA